jgi:hypothetical protein
LYDTVKSLATTYAEMIEKLIDEHDVTVEKMKLLLGGKMLYKTKARAYLTQCYFPYEGS